MGIAANLFFSTEDKENCLDWRVRPSDEQYKSQKDRWNDLAAHLMSDLVGRTGYPMASWLQGSYKFGTQVRPPSPSDEFDIDLGVYFQWTGEAHDGRYGAAELKTSVQDSLILYSELGGNDTTSVGDPKPRCNRIHFEDGFHIDVPCYHLDFARDARSLATAENNWEISDPKAIYSWWKRAIGEPLRPRCRRLVRYLKMWANLQINESSRPSSILITVLVADAYRGLDHEALVGDDEFLQAIVATILIRLQGSAEVANPANRKENLNRLSAAESQGLQNKLEELLSIADRALAADTKAGSSNIWSEAFGHFFPVPPPDIPGPKSGGSRALTTVIFDPQVSVRAVSAGKVYTGLNSVGPIPKGCAITFTIANAQQLPQGARVKWMVRNAGAEAEHINDLGHYAGEGISTARDSAYRGGHFMDVTITLNGRLIGSRRVPVSVTGLGIPIRNPPRPAWVKFRRKK